MMAVIVIFIHMKNNILRNVYIYTKTKKSNPVYVRNTESSLEQ